MSVQISQKYRPFNIKNVLDQAHIKRAIIKSVKERTFSSCYLFYGDRGIGKTTIARIFAKMANCSNIYEEDCCDKCDSCIEMSENSSFNIIEIDGASNRGVGDAEIIKEFATSGIAKGGHRFIIVDEVHMLSSEAFNCMLKILEEPPKNISFIFITTEYDKVPRPIISRSILMKFYGVDNHNIQRKLEKICADANIKVDDNVVNLVAKQSNGCMRDGESMLESILLSRRDAETVSEQDVLDILDVLPFAFMKEIDTMVKEEKDAVGFVCDMLKQCSPEKALETLTEHFYTHILAKSGNTDKILCNEKQYYKESCKIYSYKELENIMSGIAAVSSSCKKSQNTSFAWVSLLVQRIVRRKYAVSYVDFMNYILKTQDGERNKHSETRNSEELKECLLKFIKKEFG